MKPKRTRVDETTMEVALMMEHGMERISIRELQIRAEAAGYKIDPALCFNYFNEANERAYKARSIGWKHVKTGLGFAQTNAPQNTLPELQAIRKNCFVFNRGRIWEL